MTTHTEKSVLLLVPLAVAQARTMNNLSAINVGDCVFRTFNGLREYPKVGTLASKVLRNVAKK